MITKTEPVRVGEHSLMLDNRKSINLTGITDVDSFDERTIVVYTQLGELTIQGRDLHVNNMSVETGKLSVEGDIWALVYGDKDKKSPVSFFAKLFK